MTVKEWTAQALPAQRGRLVSGGEPGVSRNAVWKDRLTNFNGM